MSDTVLTILRTLAEGADTVADLLDMLVEQYPQYAAQVTESMAYAQEIMSSLSTDLLIHLV